jgi:sugar lactone lactonase YvrE
MIPPGNEIVTTFAGSAAAVSLADGPALSLGIASPESLFVDPFRGGVWLAEAILSGGGVVRYISSNSTPAGGYGMVGVWGTVIAGGVSALAVDGLIPAFGHPTGLSMVSSSPTATATTFVVADSMGNSLRSLTCTLCPIGFWCGAGGVGTQPCPPGVYAATPGLATSNCSGPCTCPPGYACAGGAIGATPTAGCTLCPVGAVCPGGSSPPIPCACSTSACSSPGLSSEPPGCQWMVTTGAGNGGSGSRNSPTSGTLATFSAPKGLSYGVRGGAPGLFVADTSSNVIRWVNISGGAATSVVTLSGSGVGASMDGSGSAASFLAPQGVIPWRAPLATSPSLLPSGLMALVLEAQAVGTLRGVYANGSVVTLLGSGLSTPGGLEQDPSTGIIYIANQNAHTVVGVNPSSFLPFVLAGVPGTAGYVDSPISGYASRLNGPSSLALFPATPASPFALYVTEAAGHRVRVVGVAGATSTLAGSGVSGSSDGVGTLASFATPTGITFDPTGLALYVAEVGGHRVRRVWVRTRAVSTLVGSKAVIPGFADSSPTPFLLGAFNGPSALTVVPSTGQVWVGDSANNRLRILSGSTQSLGYYNATQPCLPGYYGSVLGLTDPTCSGPCTAAPGFACGYASTSPSGTLVSHGLLCALVGSSPALPCACPDTCSTPGLSSPPQGAGTGSPAWQVSTLTTLNTTAGFPARGLTYYPDIGDASGGVLFIIDDGFACVWQYSLATGAVVTFSGMGVAGFADGSAGVAKFNRPHSITAQPSSGSLYVADFANHRVRTVSVTSRAVTTLVGNGVGVDLDGVGTSSQLNGPVSLSLDPSGAYLFVVEFSGCSVRRVTLGTLVVRTLAGIGSLCGAAIDGPGVASQFNALVGVYAGAGGGTVYIAERNNARVRVLYNATAPDSTANTTTVSTVVGWPGVAGFADGPASSTATVTLPLGLVVADGGSTLLFTDASGPLGAGKVRSVTLSASGPSLSPTVTTIAGPLDAPAYVIDKDGFGSTAYLAQPMSLALVNGTLYTLTVPGGLKKLNCSVCPLGSFCINGAPRPCPWGTYGAATGLSSASACTPCTSAPGYTCAPGSVATGGSYQCLPGTWCPGGSSPPLPCTSPAACTSPGLAVDPLFNSAAAAAGLNTPLAWSYTPLSGNGAPTSIDGSSTGGGASHRSPTGLALGTAGLYVADFLSNKVRLVSLDSDRTITYVGSGVTGAADGVGTAATLGGPHGLCVDPASQTLYIGEYYNHKVRAVAAHPSAITTTLAGSGVGGSVDGVGTAARFNNPTTLALDATTQVLYVVEETGCVVRAIDLASQVVSRLAGSGACGVRRDGSLLFATFPSGGGPGGIALDTFNQRLYLALWGGNNILSLDLAGGTTSLLVGSSTGVAGSADGVGTSSCTFSGPRGVSLEPGSSALLVAEWVGHTLRRVPLNSGSNSAPLPSRTLGIPGCTGNVARNPYSLIPSSTLGTYYYTDFVHNRVMVASLGSPCFLGQYCTLVGNANTSSTLLPTLCPAGRFGATTALTTPVCSGPCTSPPGFGCPAGSTNSTGVPCPSGFACAGGASPPLRCALSGVCGGGAIADPFPGPPGVNLSSSSSPPGIQWVVTTLAGGGSASLDGQGSAVMLNAPAGLSLAPDGMGLYISEYTQARVRKVQLLGSPPGNTPQTAYLSTFLGPTAATNGFTDGTGEGALLRSPFGLTPLNSTTTLLVDAGNFALRAITLPCTVTTLVGTGVASRANGIGTSAGLNTPSTMVVDTLTPGAAYVIEEGGCAIRYLNLTTLATSYFVGSGVCSSPTLDGSGSSATFFNPSAAVQDTFPATSGAPSTGRLLVADWNGNKVREVTLPGGAVSTLIGSGVAASIDGVGQQAALNGPRGLALDGVGCLFIGEAGGFRIRRVVLATLQVVTLVGMGVSSGSDGIGTVTGGMGIPLTMVVLSPGSILVSDYSTFRLRLVTARICAPGYYCAPGSTSAAPQPCPPGVFSGPLGGATTPTCSGPCNAAPGYGCGWASTSPSGSLCPVGSWCGGGALPPTPCTCPATCPSPGATSDPYATAVWSSSTIAGGGASGAADGLGTAATFTSIRGLRVSPTLATSASLASLTGSPPPTTTTVCVTDGVRIRLLTLNANALAQGGAWATVSLLAGSVTGSADGTGASASFGISMGCTWTPSGGLVVADVGGFRLRSVTVPGGVVTTLDSLGTTGGLPIDGSRPQFGDLAGIATLSSGGFIVVDADNNALRAVSPTGYVTLLAGSYAGIAGYADGVGTAVRFDNPWGIACDSAVPVTLACYVGDWGNARVRVLSPFTSSVRTLAGSSVGAVDGRYNAVKFNGPVDLTLTPSGLLVIAMYAAGGDSIRLIDPATGTTTTIAGGTGVRGVGDAQGGDIVLSAPIGVNALGGAFNGTILFAMANTWVKALTCSACQPGFYCIGGKPFACPAGTYNGDINGGSLAGDCSPCTSPRGFACLPASTNSTGVACPIGFFCPGGCLSSLGLCLCGRLCGAGQ